MGNEAQAHILLEQLNEDEENLIRLRELGASPDVIKMANKQLLNSIYQLDAALTQ